MMTGEQIRAARERAGLTQEQLGQRVGVTLRTVGNWERGATVPRNRMAALESALRGHLDTGGVTSPLEDVSDVELLAEIARRLARTDPRAGESDDKAPMYQAPVSGAHSGEMVTEPGVSLSLEEAASRTRHPVEPGQGPA